MLAEHFVSSKNRGGASIKTFKKSHSAEKTPVSKKFRQRNIFDILSLCLLLVERYFVKIRI